MCTSLPALVQWQPLQGAAETLQRVTMLRTVHQGEKLPLPRNKEPESDRAKEEGKSVLTWKISGLNSVCLNCAI